MKLSLDLPTLKVPYELWHDIETVFYKDLKELIKHKDFSIRLNRTFEETWISSSCSGTIHYNINYLEFTTYVFNPFDEENYNREISDKEISEFLYDIETFLSYTDTKDKLKEIFKNIESYLKKYKKIASELKELRRQRDVKETEQFKLSELIWMIDLKTEVLLRSIK